MRAAIYARVSSAAQRDAHTIESQLRVLRVFVAAQGWTLAGEYIDDGRSAKAGKLELRDGFTALVLAAERRSFDLLVVTDIDRLTRTDDMRERAEILGPFQKANIRIVTPSGGELDLRTLLGELYVTMQAIVAAEENRKRAERIKAGKLRAIAENRKPAGPTPFGLMYSRSSGQWSIDEHAAAVAREIHRRVTDGESCIAIADDLSIRSARAPRGGWSRAGVYRIARAKHLLGTWYADKERGAAIAVPPILTTDEWNASQRALISHGKRGLRRTKHVYLLEGMATCAECGQAVLIRSQTPARNGRVNPSAYVCRGRKLLRSCKAKIVTTAELDTRVWASLIDALAQPDLAEALAAVDQEHVDNVHDWAADAAGYRAHLERLKKHELAMMGKARRGLVSADAIDLELAAVARERKGVQKQLESAEDAIASTTDERTRLSCAREVIGELRDAFADADPEDRRELLSELMRGGGVILANGMARLDLRLPRAARAGSRAAGAALSIVQGSTAGYRTEHETIGRSGLRLRVVA